jgi:hypothetical protein
MPLFTVTLKANRSAKEKNRLSMTIHAASVVAGYPEDDPLVLPFARPKRPQGGPVLSCAAQAPLGPDVDELKCLVSSGTDTSWKVS